jgi:TRAP-type C4-dicarboxylate transport system permease small subunit
MGQARRYSLEGTIASLLFIVLFGVLLVQVFGRTPLFVGPVWTEELARWIWVWMAFIAIGEVERQDAQLRMGFIAEALPKGARRWLYTAIDVVYLGIMGHLCVIGFRSILRTWSNESVTLPVSDAALYASAFVASILIIARIARRLADRFRSGSNEGGGR